MNLRTLGAFLILMVIPIACNPAADSPETAKVYLLATPDWAIEEVYVNNALSYKDGKAVDNFGGIAFNRYMESVQFREDGAFVGRYPGEEKATVLHWQIDPATKTIVVTAADTTQDKRSGWTIAPRNVREDSFEMSTETTAFDYPRVTKIMLKFKKKD
ncbi:hypothetical protein [Salmonirosea aquatica]|uniref:Lipocalin-like domain-containing protein n=1 Tax=Salmonirosea aquatica TaxID=2654236 RepID=A0A7C9FR67_9BACT|nr:hypothetical protein [Cytophagaceae bacterium SJW1-29]